MERLSPGRMKPTKKTVTTVIRLTAMTSMMATSLPKIDVCRSRGLVRAASDELIAGPADGADERGALGVVAQLLAQAADQHVDGAVVSVPVNAAGLVHDALAAEDAAAAADEESQQLELCSGQVELHSLQSRR